ncbi:WGR domain-containing protein [Jiella sp. M17.18]|uniref:WGR domain-containing protein n=1 Tax=Jiella sp. M17.18 TaxID=3234247 RepID=UPI0034DF26E5
MMRVQLRREDPAKNMRRFYVMEIQPDLFGQYTLFREWGRIGRAGTVQETPFPTAEAAEAALERQWRAKVRRGHLQPPL